MSVLWAGSMRGPGVQARLVLLLLLLLSGRTRTVLGQEEEEVENPEVETEDVGEGGEEGDVTPPEEVTDPPVSESSTTPLPDLTGVTDTGVYLHVVEDGTSSEEVGSGGSGDAPPDSTTLFGTEDPTEDEGLDMLLIAVPAALAVLIIGGIVGGVFMYRRRNSKNRPSELKREDPYLEGSSTEKVPMPMFEEDVPSVLELEMDELDDWMKYGESTDLNQQV